ncbi:hypothetical protein PSI9734_02053 [Pseudidiomarina piscicola]|uniref:Lipoprotein n=1 Tax=Pseudidiomarina piscicola TaxID=2614830 RepID=A0A6S6WQJ9_9GAMM|nr:DUF3299 domain-containing protein [Pseudidiomarina piscicola]CAB0151678.1 hypothetical protein PSI9734_02053 [Pseudidiomarina piscicola]VZT41143.1 hypothetical protein PSI9734_02053 [Pseudomonas aeruginosa]
MIKNWLLGLTALTLLSISAASAADYREVEWKSLIPEGYKPPVVRSQAYYDMNPEAMGQPELNAPVVEALDGQKIRIPGFVVQLQAEDSKVTEFLLVPYEGACIHVPPPPPNQVLLVRYPEGYPMRQAFNPVWVEGTVTVERADGELAVVGYQLDAATVTPYGG